MLRQTSIRHQSYLDVYNNDTIIKAQQRRIASFTHQLVTIEQTKVALKCFDDKRNWINKNVSRPYGYISEEEQRRKEEMFKIMEPYEVEKEDYAAYCNYWEERRRREDEFQFLDPSEVGSEDYPAYRKYWQERRCMEEGRFYIDSDEVEGEDWVGVEDTATNDIFKDIDTFPFVGSVSIDDIDTQLFGETRKRPCAGPSAQYGGKSGKFEEWLRDIHAQEEEDLCQLQASLQRSSGEEDLMWSTSVRSSLLEEHELDKLMDKTFGHLPVKEDEFHFNAWQTIPSSDDDDDDEEENELDRTVNEMYDMLESQLC